ncbi:MAG: ABC transporter substrate-binding protein [Pyrinomonadaceae bacterium]
MKKIYLVFGLTVLLLLAIAGCVQKGGDNAATNTGDTIKVGVFADLTGTTASFGQSTKNGIELAVEEINNSGGVLGKKIQLVVEDDQGRPEQAKTVVSKLINQDKVQAVLGEVASTNSLAAAPVAQEAKIPMITPSSTNPKVTQVGDYIFRVCFIDPFQGSVMAQYAAKNLNAKTAAIFGDVQSDYSKGLSEVFKQEFERSGGKVISEQSYAQTDPDFKGQLTAIRSAKPDVIYIPGYYGQVGIIAKQARELGMNMPLLGGDGWDSPDLWKLGGDALKNAYISNHYSADNPAPEIQNFVKAYQAKYGAKPDSLAALAYDSAKVLADSIKRAGSTNARDLRDAIGKTKDFEGVTGKITINADRNAVKPAVVLELDPSKNGFNYKETIYPEGMTAPVANADTNSSMNSNMPANGNMNSNMMNSNMNSGMNSNMMNSNMNSNMNSTANSTNK